MKGLMFFKYPVSNAALYIAHNDLPHKAAILPDSFAICANVSNLAKLLAKLVIAILLEVFLIIFIRLSLSFSSEPECPSTLELVESLTIASTPLFPKDFIFSWLKFLPTNGFGSIFQSPVWKILPNLVLIPKAFGSGIEWVVDITSISKGPNLKLLFREIFFNLYTSNKTFVNLELYL